jgi:hypothetical protein
MNQNPLPLELYHYGLIALSALIAVAVTVAFEVLLPRLGEYLPDRVSDLLTNSLPETSAD